jgi:exportin-7
MDAAQLAQVESLCRALYEGTNATLRAEAQQQLLPLCNSAEYIPQCQFILDHSIQPYAQIVASTSLESIVSQFWNNFTLEQKLDLRNYVLNTLAVNAHKLQDFVVNSLSKLACRISKLGWFDAPEHRDIITEITKFLEATVNHHLIGLKILISMVEEMNSPTIGRTLTVHRKTAVSFRDHSLFAIFQIAITTLQQIQMRTMEGISQEDQDKMAYLALLLADGCLNFDFIGTNPEESAEDVGTVQVPSSWRPIVQDTTTIQLFFDYYFNTQPPRSSLALQSLVHLSSVRRSLFPSERERAAFLQALMTGIHSIMQSQKGLDHEENYHEFCRLLGRLKASYQLSELVKTKGFNEWLELAGEFTIRSLQNWKYSMNSIHYLLALWGRLVAALPYLRTEASDTQRQAQILRQCVLRVVEGYIKTMLDSVEEVVRSEGGVEDPLEDEGSLREQMDRLPIIARLQFDTVAQYLITLFEQGLGMYQEHLSSSMISDGAFKVLEGRMTWLTYMVGAVIGGQTPGVDPHKNNNTDLLWDGRLCRCVFQLARMVDFRLTQSGGKLRSDEKLELSILSFFKSFKKCYLLDASTPATPVYSMAPGASPAHPMLSLALSYSTVEAAAAGDQEKEISMEPSSV